MWNSWNLQAPAWFRNCSRPLQWWLEASLLRQVLEKGVSCKIGIGYWCCQNLTYLADVSDSWCQNTFLRNKLNDTPCNPQKHTSSDVIPPPWLAQEPTCCSQESCSSRQHHIQLLFHEHQAQTSKMVLCEGSSWSSQCAAPLPSWQQRSLSQLTWWAGDLFFSVTVC